jgi:hypothetical protein
MNKQDLMREVEKLTPSERETYEAVKVHANNLADALAFAKGTIRQVRHTSTATNAGKTDADIPDAERAREGYRDRLINAWKGAD